LSDVLNIYVSELVGRQDVLYLSDDSLFFKLLSEFQASKVKTEG